MTTAKKELLQEIQGHLDTSFNIPAPKENEYNISVYMAGHDRAIAISRGTEVLEVIEAERLHNLKNGDWEQGKVAKNYPTNSYELTTPDLYEFYNQQLFNYVNEKYPNVVFKNCIAPTKKNIKTKSQYQNFVFAHHHSSHALGAFYQSPFQEALAITYDGGSPDHVRIGIFHLKRKQRPILIDALQQTIVGRYQDLGLLFDCFPWQPAKAAHYLPGKIMALSSFGKANIELLPYYKNVCSGEIQPETNFLKNKFREEFNPEDYYTSRLLKETIEDSNLWKGDESNLDKDKRIYDIVCLRLFLLNELLEKEGIENSKELAPLGLALTGLNVLLYKKVKVDVNYLKSLKRISGDKIFDMAATLQLACEELFFDKLSPYLEKFPNMPIVLAGGGALNIILNTRIKKQTGRPVFVGPDPSDCGLALGALLGILKPGKPYSNPYTGMPILDINSLGATVMEHIGLNSELSKYSFIGDVRKDFAYVAKLISEGKILGIIRDNSERGPRALGNRSIICYASLPHIKDTLNAKVKYREWFRPFAPIVRLEDVSKYFDWVGESRYMNFCIDVREEFKDKLQAVTHVDGTARVQTITKQQNVFMYNLLTELDKLTGIGVTVNTSFNVNGRPLINSVKDAFYMLENTQLDGIIIQNTLILKKESIK